MLNTKECHTAMSHVMVLYLGHSSLVMEQELKVILVLEKLKIGN